MNFHQVPFKSQNIILFYQSGFLILSIFFVSFSYIYSKLTVQFSFASFLTVKITSIIFCFITHCCFFLPFPFLYILYESKIFHKSRYPSSYVPG
jgi:hypothetical protein